MSDPNAFDEELFDEHYEMRVQNGCRIYPTPWVSNSFERRRDSPDFMGFRTFPDHGIVRMALAGNEASAVDRLEKGHNLDTGERVLNVSPERLLRIAAIMAKEAVRAMRERDGDA